MFRSRLEKDQVGRKGWRLTRRGSRNEFVYDHSPSVNPVTSRRQMLWVTCRSSIFMTWSNQTGYTGMWEMSSRVAKCHPRHYRHYTRPSQNSVQEISEFISFAQLYNVNRLTHWSSGQSSNVISRLRTEP